MYQESEDRCKTIPQSRTIEMREMELTPDEAQELRERIEHPRTRPARTSVDLPIGYEEMLRR